MKMSEIRKIVDQEYLKRRLDYDPETGIFTWKYDAELTPKNKISSVGTRAGSERSQNDGRYAVRRIVLFGAVILEHHLVWVYMTGEWPPEDMVIDHKNRDATDNRWDNLHLITATKNHKNVSMNCSNTSGVTGVHWDEKSHKFIGRVTVNGVRTHVGSYDTLEAAEKAVMAARRNAGFSRDSGLTKKNTRSTKPLDLGRKSTSGCRFISFVSSKQLWCVRVPVDGEMVVMHSKSLKKAKRRLKDILDAHPDHPYHGLPIP